MHRDALVKAAARLGVKGYVPPAVANDLEGRAKKVRLSLTAKGDLAPNPVQTEILAYQKLTPNTAWKAKGGDPKQPSVRMSHTRPKPAVSEADRSPYHEMGDEDTDSVVAAFEATGRPKLFGVNGDGK